VLTQIVSALILRERMGDLQIVGPDARLEAVFGVVGEFGDLIEVVVVERLHADDRADDLCVREVSIVREGKRLVIAPSNVVWDDFLTAPGLDLPARDQPALLRRPPQAALRRATSA
jgi:hypothetical protein